MNILEISEDEPSEVGTLPPSTTQAHAVLSQRDVIFNRRFALYIFYMLIITNALY